MCVPGCSEVVASRLSRRKFFGSSLAATATVALSGCIKPLPVGAASEKTPTRSFSRAVDLTHTLSETFPTFGGKPTVSKKRFSTMKDGYNTYTWELFEHTGTHIDAPIHFADGARTVDQLTVGELVVPLVVIDITAKAAVDADAELTIDDIVAFEKRYGRIPDGACVAMNSGWWAKADTAEFRNADAKGVMHFPGFHHETAAFLGEQRAAVGIAVDTLSLDPGRSKDFSTHYHWLPSNRWGIECLGNLGELPATGATIVVGAPKFAGGTGGPSRVFALV